MIGKSRKEGWPRGFLDLIGFVVILGGLMTVAYQGVYWVRFGAWMHFDVANLWDWLSGTQTATNWYGLPRVALWVLQWPLSFGLIVLGAMSVWVGRVAEELRQ